jgi:exo-beta-1,3-glucanase (GH17 family)
MLDRVRKETRKPVSTAEPWHIWLKPENAALAEHVDYLAVHMFPYWEGIGLDHAVEHIVTQMGRLQTAFPEKRIVIAEVGWPSDGRTREQAEASTANEALFLRTFIKTALDKGYTYYVLEAFDQPWKEKTAEGGAGAYWGVWDANRQPKVSLRR